MNRYSELPWNPEFYKASPMYQLLQPWAEEYVEFKQWPGLDVYEQHLRKQNPAVMTLSGKVLTIVEQDVKPNSFHEHYAPRIYTSGELQTRINNWHDFFQFLTWMMFPKSKAVINSIHIPMARERIESGNDTGRRSPLENAMSLFDEGGALILSSNHDLLEMVRNFDWKSLFWKHRKELKDQFQCIIYGHALYEKGLAPYLGMTANTILFEVDKDYFSASSSEKLKFSDQLLAEYLNRDVIEKPKDLQPFPILGMPGWYQGNEDEIFYENQEYFRPGRRR